MLQSHGAFSIYGNTTRLILKIISQIKFTETTYQTL